MSRYTQVTLNDRDDEPTQEELETVWELMEDAAEDGWLRKDVLGNVIQEVDEDDLRRLLMTNMPKAASAFGYVRIYGEEGKIHEFNFPAYLCGYYTIHNTRYTNDQTYFFEQWSY